LYLGQKSKTVVNLLENLRHSERIDNAGTRKSPIMLFAEKNAETTTMIKEKEDPEFQAIPNLS